MPMNINIQGSSTTIYGGNLLSNRGLKSTQQKMERQAQRDNQIAFYEERKQGLKNMKCETVEEIARKLDLFHTYEDQIAAAKAAYNSEQMWHMMDESQEIGEKIAEAAEKTKPKTPEERMEDLVDEAMGIESDGIMDELQEAVEEALEEIEEIQDGMKDVLPGELTEQMPDVPAGETPDQASDVLQAEMQDQVSDALSAEASGQASDALSAEAQDQISDALSAEAQGQVSDVLSAEMQDQVSGALPEETAAGETMLPAQELPENVPGQMRQSSVLTSYNVMTEQEEARPYSPVDIRL